MLRGWSIFGYRCPLFLVNFMLSKPAIWTERRRPGEVCRDLGVDWGVLQQWQDRAMQGMLMGLQPRVWVERGVALSPRLAVLLKKSQAGMMRGLDKRLKKLQENRVPQEEQEMAAEEKL